MASTLANGGATCIDGLLWIGQTYPDFFCGRAESCVNPERPKGPHCFVHEAERRGVSRRLSAVPPWAVPGRSRIFLVHKGGEEDPSRGRIFGYFVLDRTEVLTESDELATDGEGREARPRASVEARRTIRTRRCANGKTIVTHRYDPDNETWVSTGKKCPDRPKPEKEPKSTIRKNGQEHEERTEGKPPETHQNGDLQLTESAGGKRIVTHVYQGRKWHRTGTGDSAGEVKQMPLENEKLAQHRGCSIREDAGAVYLVDALAAKIADVFAERLDGASIRGCDDKQSVQAGWKIFDAVVDEVPHPRHAATRIPPALRGKATVREELVLFDHPPLFERQPRAAFRSLAHIDGERLLLEISKGVERPAIRSCRHRSGVTTQQEVAAVLAERSHANKAFARQLLSELAHLAREELDEFGEFRLPGMGTLKRGKDGRVGFRAYKALT